MSAKLKRHTAEAVLQSNCKAAKIDANDEPLMFEGKAAATSKVFWFPLFLMHDAMRFHQHTK